MQVSLVAGDFQPDRSSCLKRLEDYCEAVLLSSEGNLVVSIARWRYLKSLMQALSHSNRRMPLFRPSDFTDVGYSRQQLSDWRYRRLDKLLLRGVGLTGDALVEHMTYVACLRNLEIEGFPFGYGGMIDGA